MDENNKSDTAKSPLSDLMFDWVTILHEKAR